MSNKNRRKYKNLLAINSSRNNNNSNNNNNNSSSSSSNRNRDKRQRSSSAAATSQQLFLSQQQQQHSPPQFDHTLVVFLNVPDDDCAGVPPRVLPVVVHLREGRADPVAVALGVELATKLSNAIARRLPQASLPGHVGLAAKTGVVAHRNKELLAVAVRLADDLGGGRFRAVNFLDPIYTLRFDLNFS